MNKLCTHPIVIAVATISTILVAPVLLLMDREYSKFAAVLAMIFIPILSLSVFFMIKSVYDKFQDIDNKLDLAPSEFKCKNNCVDIMQENHSSKMVHLESEFKSVHNLLGSISDRVEKTPESFELLKLVNNRLIFIINEHKPKKYKITIRGMDINNVNLKSTMSENVIDSENIVNEFTVLRDSGETISEVESIYKFSTKESINFGIVDIEKISKRGAIAMSMEITCDGIPRCNVIKISV